MGIDSLTKWVSRFVYQHEDPRDKFIIKLRLTVKYFVRGSADSLIGLEF